MLLSQARGTRIAGGTVRLPSGGALDHGDSAGPLADQVRLPSLKRLRLDSSPSTGSDRLKAGVGATLRPGAERLQGSL